MNEAQVNEQGSRQRRSSRVFTRIPVRASGKSIQGRKFRENSQTIVINAHGGLLYLQEEVAMGADLVLINPVTEEEQECRVVYLGDTSEKGTRVASNFFHQVRISGGSISPRKTGQRARRLTLCIRVFGRRR